MELRELLEFYQAYAELELKDEKGNVIDYCKNGNLIKNLWGSRKVIRFFPQNDYITVILKDQEVAR